MVKLIKLINIKIIVFINIIDDKKYAVDNVDILQLFLASLLDRAVAVTEFSQSFVSLVMCCLRFKLWRFLQIFFNQYFLKNIIRF